MAEESILIAPPATDDRTPLPTQQKTESREVVLPPGATDSASRSLEADLEKAVQAKTERVAAEGESSAQKPAKSSSKAKPAKAEPEKTEAAKPDEKPTEPEKTDARSKLSKLIDEETAAEKPEVEEAEETAKDEEEQSIEELTNVPAEESKNWKEKTHKRFIGLSRKVSSEAEAREKAEKVAAEREARIKELEARKPDGIPDEIKPQLEELQMHRRVRELENSTEIKEKYDNIVADAEKTIGDILKQYGVDNALKAIESEGGFAAFSRSQKTAHIDGETKTFAEYARELLSGMNVADAEAIRAKLAEQRNTQDAKKRFIDSEKAKAGEYFKNIDSQVQNYTKAQQEAAQAQRKQIDGFIQKVQTETEWMQDRQADADATPEQKAEIARHNKHAAAYREYLHGVLNAKTMDELLAASLDAVSSYKLRADLARATAENKALKAKLDKKAAASATTRAGSIAATPTQSKPRDPMGGRIYDGVAGDALEAALDAKARGED